VASPPSVPTRPLFAPTYKPTSDSWLYGRTSSSYFFIDVLSVAHFLCTLSMLARWTLFPPSPKKEKKTLLDPILVCLFVCAFHAADKHFENGGHDRLITFYEQLFSVLS